MRFLRGNNLINKTTLLNKIKRILLKKAEGYFYNEEVLEYGEDKAEKFLSNCVSEQISFLKSDDKIKTKNKPSKSIKANPSTMVLLKKKITSHHVPPDLAAIKMLIELINLEQSEDNTISNLSDEELIKLRDDTIKKLLEMEDKNEN